MSTLTTAFRRSVQRPVETQHFSGAGHSGLIAAGYDQVDVVCGDGDLGHPGG